MVSQAANRILCSVARFAENSQEFEFNQIERFSNSVQETALCLMLYVCIRSIRAMEFYS